VTLAPSSEVSLDLRGFVSSVLVSSEQIAEGYALDVPWWRPPRPVFPTAADLAGRFAWWTATVDSDLIFIRSVRLVVDLGPPRS
jgi:hypothetical protein